MRDACPLLLIREASGLNLWEEEKTICALGNSLFQKFDRIWYSGTA